METIILALFLLEIVLGVLFLILNKHTLIRTFILLYVLYTVANGAFYYFYFPDLYFWKLVLGVFIYLILFLLITLYYKNGKINMISLIFGLAIGVLSLVGIISLSPIMVYTSLMIIAVAIVLPWFMKKIKSNVSLFPVLLLVSIELLRLVIKW